MLMNDHFQTIYNTRAADYDLMVSREDYEGKILPALRDLTGFDVNAVVAEFGAGTGRITRLLVPHVRHIYAFDRTPHMLDTAKTTMPPHANWTLGVADNRQMPLRSKFADFSVEGWSFAHFAGWYPQTWREEATRAIYEMERVTKSGGTVIMIETLGTGSKEPHPPAAHLEAFYAWLEGEHGFQRTWIRTDYRFASLEEAERLTRFFFGDELADRVRREYLVILPECTGLWSKRVA